MAEEFHYGDIVVFATTGVGRYQATLYEVTEDELKLKEGRKKVEEWLDLSGIAIVNAQLTYLEPHFGEITHQSGLVAWLVWEPFGMLKKRYLYVSPVPNVDSVIPDLKDLITKSK